MGDLTANFSRVEFMCPCYECGAHPDRPYTKIEVVNALQDLRNFLRESLRINRGVSCAAHNAAIGGARDSRHLPEYRDGADMESGSSEKTYRIIRYLMMQNAFTFIEICPKHIHVDMRPGTKKLIVGTDK